MRRSPDVLFVCVHNAGRSQMAKALFNWIAEERGLEVWADSAGTVSSDRVHPEVVTVMGELGIDVSGEMPKVLTDDMLAGDPRVFTMGCAVDTEACPSLRLERVEDWGLPDPTGRPLEEVRAIRDEIKQRVAAVVAEVARV